MPEVLSIFILPVIFPAAIPETSPDKSNKMVSFKIDLTVYRKSIFIPFSFLDIVQVLPILTGSLGYTTLLD